MEENILFVDDDINILDTFRRTFRRKFRFDCANSGQEALDMMQKAETSYAVIVCDQQMPSLSGTFVLAEVHDRWPD
ncbi:MAG: response regulator, partial [Candidatus Cloacimonetes bacterium]|nr:response regulator [Candidatus Cloacimonadota bacterium]